MSNDLFHLVRERIHILDGAMGTMIQRLKLDEAAVRGERFANHHKDLVRFSDLLCITRPDAISDIHYAYLESGADIVETNSFGASPIGMAEMELPEELTRDLNYAAVDCARKAVDRMRKRTRVDAAMWPVRSVRPPSNLRSARRSRMRPIGTSIS